MPDSAPGAVGMPELDGQLPGVADMVVKEPQEPGVANMVVKEPQITTHLKSPDTYVQPAPPGPDQAKFFQRQDFPSYLPSAKSAARMVEVSYLDAHKHITALDGSSDPHSCKKSFRDGRVDIMVEQTNPIAAPQSLDDKAAQENPITEFPSIVSELPNKIKVPKVLKKFKPVLKRTEEEIQQEQRTRNNMDKSLAGEGRPNDWMKMALEGRQPVPQRPYRCQWTAKKNHIKGMYARRQTLKTPDEFERGQTPDLERLYGAEADSRRCGHCSEQLGEEPLIMLVDRQRRIQTCSHFLHCQCYEELRSLKETCTDKHLACPECNAPIVDTVLLPNPFKNPDGWFDALDIRHCGRVPRSQIAEALAVATKLDLQEVNYILDATMGGNPHDRYECMDCRYILAKIEKITVHDAMDSMRSFSRLESQMQMECSTDIDSDDDVSAWILSITERRCARLPKPSLDDGALQMDGMAALADLGLRRHELARAYDDYACF
jgi:hypothetical protein